MIKFIYIIVLVCLIPFVSDGQCNQNFDLGADIEICQGDMISIDASSSFETYLWNDNSTGQTLQVNQSGSYFCTVRAVDMSSNLILNGDFEQGNTLFTSDYTYYPVADVFGPNASYGITNNPNVWFNPFSACSDHSSGSGLMLLADGSSTNAGNDAVWCQMVTLSANTEYIFSYWSQSVTGLPYANLRVEINGVVLGNSLAPNTVCMWEQTSYTWNSNTSSMAQICIYDNELSGNGNDFAIDDISLNTVCSYSDTVVVNLASIDTTKQDINLCQGDSFLIGNNFQTSNGTFYEQNMQGNCVSYIAYNLFFSPLPIANAGNDTTVIEGSILNLNAQNVLLGSEIEWSSDGNVFSDEQIVEVEVQSTTTFTLNVSRNGCIAEDEIKIRTVEIQDDILFPTAFTPNSDGVNDLFRIVNSENLQFISLSIYNRWGERIHYGEDEMHAWDGKYKGESQSLDDYIFVSKLKYKEKEMQQISGSFSLIR